MPPFICTQTNHLILNWHRHLIIYNLHVKSFSDSNGDGIGDLRGLTQKLDYLEDLGVNCISLLPFYPSPMKDDGYDVADFCDVHPDYGTLEDFKVFMEEAHKRGIKVICELILNHTSTAHPWFKRARAARKGSKHRNFYIWSDTPTKFPEAEIVFTDFESSNWAWDQEAKAYFFHRYYSHQADLNFDNPEVQEAMLSVVDFWMGLGVDGLRLIAAPYIYKREGTNCENLPEAHLYLKKLRKHVDQNYKDRILLGDVNLWPEDAASYFGDSDELHVNFHFPLMPRLYMALQTENRFPIVDILEQTPIVADGCAWALFLRNHDDLSLDMVTEEERDYLYKSFAQDHGARLNHGIRRRLAPLLSNDRRKIELLNILLFSLRGTPVIYYGDEIGMGDNIYLGDRDGIRTPMQWNSDRNAGFSSGNPQKLFLPVIRDPQYRYDYVNVDNQATNPSSLLWWMRNIISMRKRLTPLTLGTGSFVQTDNSKILAFTRTFESETILVVCNLSKSSQAVRLSMPGFEGITPVEAFSQNKFPEIRDAEYTLTLGPYGYYWFSLEKREAKPVLDSQYQVSRFESPIAFEQLFENNTWRGRFEKKVLSNYLFGVRWFGGKSREIVSLNAEKVFPVLSESKEELGKIVIMELNYAEGLSERYLLPMKLETDPLKIAQYKDKFPKAIVCDASLGGKEGMVVDAIFDADFRNQLFLNMLGDRKVLSGGGQLDFESGQILRMAEGSGQVSSEVLKAEQSNTAVIYNDQFFFKFFRKLDEDINPDLELVRFLSERTAFRNSPRYGGSITLHAGAGSPPIILGMLQNKISNQGDAWSLTLHGLSQFYELVLAKTDKKAELPPLLQQQNIRFEDIPASVSRLIGSVAIEQAVLLAQRTAQMHIALASDLKDPDLSPEAFTQHYQRSLYSACRKLVGEKCDNLERVLARLPAHVREEAQKVLDLEPQLLQLFAEISTVKIKAVKTRVHGDYHLGQVLFDGKDFYIIDFEGEPVASISERRLRRSPFKDLAGMLRSYHYAAYGQLLLNKQYREEDLPYLFQWAEQWNHYISGVFRTAYFEAVKGQPFIPDTQAGTDMLLRNYLLEKAIYEMGYEMNNRPDWLMIPMKGVLGIVENYKGKINTA